MASGRLAVTLRDPASSVLWFRPEVVRTVTWAGDPTRKEAGGAASLHPRHSSSAWKQVVRARAEPWRAAEVDTAEALRRHIIELNLGKQVAVAEQAVRMRDEMVAVLSHDLKSPLQVIRMSMSLLQGQLGPAPRGLETMARIDRAASRVLGRRRPQAHGTTRGHVRRRPGRAAPPLHRRHPADPTAARGAQLGSTFVKVGLVPGDGGAYLLGRTVGFSRALELMLTGRLLGTEEAERIGLVHRVVEPAELLPAAHVLAEQLAALPPLALRLTKRAAYRSFEADLEQALELAATYQGVVQNTADHHEAVQAMLERRAPKFTGA